MSMIGLLIRMFILVLSFTKSESVLFIVSITLVQKAMKAVATRTWCNNLPDKFKKYDETFLYQLRERESKKMTLKSSPEASKQLQVKYDVQELFIGNLDLLMHFENNSSLRLYL